MLKEWDEPVVNVPPNQVEEEQPGGRRAALPVRVACPEVAAQSAPLVLGQIPNALALHVAESAHRGRMQGQALRADRALRGAWVAVVISVGAAVKA